MPRKKARSTSSYISRTSQHRKLRAALKRELESTGFLICARLDCLFPGRRILPGMAWDLGHVDGTLAYSGAEHRACNRRTMTHARQRAGETPKRPPAPSMRDMTTPLADIPVEDRVRLGRWSRNW